jgi:HemY protein
MARLAFFIVIVGLLAAGAVWLANDPGTVTLAWRGWRVDTSVGVLIAGLAAIVLVVLFVIRLATAVSRSVGALVAARRERRIKRGLSSLGDGFAAVVAGQQDTARKLAKEASELLRDNAAVLVLRKEAAALRGDKSEVQRIATAMLERPGTALAGLRTLAEDAIASGDVAGARDYASRAWARRDGPPWALQMLLDIEIEAGRWTEALNLLNSKPARAAYTPQQHAQLKTRLYVQLAQSALATGDAITAAVAAKKAMGTGGLQRDAVLVFARAMTAQGRGRKAAHTIERAWAEAPSAELLAAYRALEPGETALDWAKRVEDLAQAAPEHAESRLAVAQASLAAQLWGQARSRLSGLTAEGVDPKIRARAAAMLAELEAQQRGDNDAAADWLRLALEFHESTPHTRRTPRSTAELLAS